MVGSKVKLREKVRAEDALTHIRNNEIKRKTTSTDTNCLCNATETIDLGAICGTQTAAIGAAATLGARWRDY